MPSQSQADVERLVDLVCHRREQEKEADRDLHSNDGVSLTWLENRSGLIMRIRRGITSGVIEVMVIIQWKWLELIGI